MRATRWTGDERGHGVGTGEAIVPDIEQLRDALSIPDWIAEEPETHLLPHIRRAVGQDGSRWTLVKAGVTEDHVLELTLQWPTKGDKAALRAAALTLVGSFAESNTFVRGSRRGDETVFDIATGMLEGDGPFAGHGHLVRFVVQETRQ